MAFSGWVWWAVRSGVSGNGKEHQRGRCSAAVRDGRDPGFGDLMCVGVHAGGCIRMVSVFLGAISPARLVLMNLWLWSLCAEVDSCRRPKVGVHS